ncbi:MAG: YfcE family phosphodiesterase [Pyramidobacter sp.]|nr:YfcE family phosphodiesterase [Pyramidobacter sp.]
MTAKVLVLSDTHRLLRPAVIKAAQLADYILHAGDFDDEGTFDALEALAPLAAVRGNNDWGVERRLRDSREFRIEEVRFFMVHNRADAFREMQPHSPKDFDVVVFGHTHRYYEEREDGVLWLNPGSCGRRRFGGTLSFAWLTVDGKNVTVERVDLSEADR